MLRGNVFAFRIWHSSEAEMTMRLTKSGPPISSIPAIEYITRSGEIETNARLLAEHRGRHSAEHRVAAFPICCEIIDRYASAYREHRKAKEQQGESWRGLGSEPMFSETYNDMLPVSDNGRIGDIELNLPVLSLDIPRKGAPKSVLDGVRKTGVCKLDDLTPAEFFEIAWQVRSNLMHGSYDRLDAEHQSLIVKMARALTHLTWEVVRATKFE